MAKIINVSNQSKSIEIIKLMNKDNLFREIKIYKYKDCNIFYCITDKGKLHISGSTPQGPADEKDLIYVFNKLTKKSIESFELMKTKRVLYLLESNHNYLN